jgi:hypothetical protein
MFVSSLAMDWDHIGIMSNSESAIVRLLSHLGSNNIHDFI